MRLSPLSRAVRRIFRTLLVPLALGALLGTAVPREGAALTTELVVGNLSYPVYATGRAYPGVGDLLYVLEQNGTVRVLVDDGAPSLFLDIDALVPNISGNDERGLLGFALHPDFVNNGEFFVHYSNLSGNTTVARYTIDSGNPLVADPGSAEIIFTQAQPFSNHNGGWMDFGPDGYLYLGLGDGGSANDPGNRAQNGQVLLGKILRLDVDVPNGYAIPPDNPFVGNANFLDEIWDYGLRNPYRCSFDRQTGDLWIGDVGQGTFEEVNLESPATGGVNYGWRLLEGCECFNPSTNCDPSGVTTHPIWFYCHSSSDCTPTGFSITGGYVYRGNAIPALQGTYFFADYFTSIWSLELSGPSPECRNDVTILDRTAELQPEAGGSITSVASFGEDANGELLIVDRAATTGEVYRIVPPAVGVPGALDPSAQLQITVASRNPFSERVAFTVTTELAGAPEVHVFSATGQMVRDLTPSTSNVTSHALVWDGTDDTGRVVPSGVYFIRASHPGAIVSRRVELVR